MGPVRKLFTQSSYYLASNLLVVLAGAISLPIWTRLLSQQDYGLFSLFNVTIAFMVTFSKFGLQFSSIRFYHDFSASKTASDLPSYYTTMVIGSVAISVTVTAALLGAATLFLRNQESHALLVLLPLIGAVILIQTTNNILTAFLRAEQQVTLYGLIQIVQRYAQLGLALLMVFIFGVELRNIYWGWIVSGGIIMVLLGARLLHLQRLSLPHFSPSFLKEAVVYGFPLIWAEVSNVMLSVGDRYVLQHYMGSAAVGIYSVGYNTAELIQSLLALPLRFAVIPIYLSLWNTAGEEKTARFLGEALKYYCMLGLPLALGASWFGKDIVTLLSTAKFEEAHTILPYIILPLIVHGAFCIFGAGLNIQKKSTSIMYSTLFASMVNIGLNLVLVPRLGILGAAIATTIAYLMLDILLFVQSYYYLKVPIDLASIAKYAILSMAAIYIASGIGSVAQVKIKIVLVVVIYAGSLLLFDKGLRAKVSSLY